MGGCCEGSTNNYLIFTKNNTYVTRFAVDNIDYICQLAGNSSQFGIGTDLDGAFGKEQSPYDLDTIIDLQKVPQILSIKEHKEQNINNIMHRNFISFIQKVWKN